MPLIPSIAGTRALPNVAAPVLNRERAPTADNSGVASAVGKLAKSSQMPDVPDSLAAPFKALGAVGAAIAQTGDVIGALAMKQREAESDLQIADADNRMQSLTGEFETFKQENPDPSTWAPEWQTRFGNLTEEIMGNDKLHPGARSAIQLRANRYGGQSNVDVMKSAAKETFSQAKSAFLASIDNSIETQDEETFSDALYTAKEKGYLYPHEVEAAEQRFTQRGKQLTKEAEAEAEKTEYKNAANAAIADPHKWLEENKEPWKGKEVLWDQVKNKADAQIREGTADAVDQLTNSIAGGELTVPAEIDAIESKFITPQLRDQAKRFMSQRNEYAERIDRDQNGVRNSVEMRQKAKDYNADKDKDGTEYYTLRQELYTRVPEGSRDQIGDILDAKATGRRVPARSETKEYVSKTLDNVFDSATGAIKWKTVVNSRDAKGALIRDPNEPGGYKLEWTVDHAAKQRSLDLQSEVEGKVLRFIESNPAATLPEVKAKVMEYLPEATRKGALESMKKSMPSAKVGNGVGAVTSYGYANDETPDSNSKAGIGAFVPDSEAAKIKAGKPSDFKLRDGDIAVSPDIEAQFKEAGVKPGETVMVTLANGETRSARWMDRTAQDADVESGKVKGVTKVLRGRFDFYSPNGKSKLDGVKVVRWFKPESLLAGN